MMHAVQHLSSSALPFRARPRRGHRKELPTYPPPKREREGKRILKYPISLGPYYLTCSKDPRKERIVNLIYVAVFLSKYKVLIIVIGPTLASEAKKPDHFFRSTIKTLLSSYCVFSYICTRTHVCMHQQIYSIV